MDSESKKLLCKNCIFSVLGGSICTIACLSSYFSVSGKIFQANGIVCPFVFVLSSIAINYLISNFSVREMCSAIPSAIILAACQRLGSEFTLTGHVELNNYKLYISIICMGFLFWIVISYILHYIGKVGEILGKFDAVIRRIFKYFLPLANDSRHGILTKNNRRLFLLSFFSLIILWIPAILATYPGVFSYDAMPKVDMILGERTFNNHYPVLSTLLLTACMQLGKIISGNYIFGVFVSTIVQMLIVSFAFSYALIWMWNNRIPKLVIVLGFLFLGINPVVQIMVLSATHDIIFAGLLLILVVEILDMSVNTEHYFESWKNIVRFILIAIFMCMFRNQGMYMLIVVLPFLVISFKRFRLKVFTSLIVPIVFVAVLTGPIYSSLGIVADKKSGEMLSFPIQQIARACNVVPNDIGTEEYDVIYKYIPKDNIEKYNPMSADPAKARFNNEYFLENKSDFFKVWFLVGIRNPGVYFDSFMYESYGYFYTEKTPLATDYILYDGVEGENYSFIGFERQTKFPLYDNYLRKVSRELILDKIPIVSTLTNEAFPFWIMMFLVSLFILKKRWKELSMLVLPLGYWGTLLLGPVIQSRYAFPLMVLVPLFIGVCFNRRYYRENL